MKLTLFLLALLLTSRPALCADTDFKAARAAVRAGDLPQVVALVEAGLEINAIPNNHAMNLIGYALHYQQIEIAKALIDSSAFDPAHPDHGVSLYITCMPPIRNLALLDLLLDAGVDVNSTNQQGGSCLDAAIPRGDVEMFSHLLAKGADPDQAITPYVAFGLTGEHTARELLTHLITRLEAMRRALPHVEEGR